MFSESQSIELLASRAGNVRVDEDLEAAREVVALCGHLPLAISLCGHHLAAHQDLTLRMLTDQLRDASRQQQ